jgi:hypothetical protein
MSKTDDKIAREYLKELGLEMSRENFPFFKESIRFARRRDPTISNASDFRAWVLNLPNPNPDPDPVEEDFDPLMV